jgi:hypothetical protein
MWPRALGWEWDGTRVRTVRGRAHHHTGSDH